MGFFTAFKENAYPSARVEISSTNGGFGLPTARGLSWAAQLAYDTTDEG